MSDRSTLEYVPLLKTLAVCTRRAKHKARKELMWNIGFAFLPLLAVTLAVLLMLPYFEGKAEIYKIIAGGEVMIYATAICGPVLYILTQDMEGPLPAAIQQRATSIGTLSLITWVCMFVAIMSYLVRKVAEINDLRINEELLTWASGGVLFTSVVISYVVFALRNSLASGAAPVAHEQTEDFSAAWEARDA